MPPPMRDKLLVDRVLRRLHEAAAERAPVRHRQAAGRPLRLPGVRAAGEADAERNADDVVHAADDARVDGQQHQPSTPATSRRSGVCSSTSSTAALMCDRTRIITIGVHKALGPEPRLDEHRAARLLPLRGREWRHLARPRARLRRTSNSRRLLKGINAWIASEVFAKLLAKLDVPEMGGTTYLDNSLVYWGNELGFNHIGVQRAVPAGGRRGRLHQAGTLHRLHRLGRTRLLRAGERQRHQGHPAQPVPGDGAAGDGPRARRLRDAAARPATDRPASTARTSDTWAVDYDLSTVGQILPGIKG